MASLQIGALAVYPAHGVVEVLGVETREIGGCKQDFYVLKIVDSGMRILIPTSNVQLVGLRSVMGPREVRQVYDILRAKGGVTIEGQTWNRRYRDYMEKIKTGSVFEIAEVLRDLSRLQGGKELSFSERKMLDMARTLLIKELAVAKRAPEQKIERELADLFSA
jgi:CarD family transcriptional regulator